MTTEYLHRPSGILMHPHTPDGHISVESSHYSSVPANATGDGFVPAILGFVFGLQYSRRNPGQCFEAIELNLLVADEILALLSTIYYPTHFSNFLIVQDDITNIISAVQAYCAYEEFINNFSAIWSLQGLTELMLRCLSGGVSEGYSIVMDFINSDSDFYVMVPIGRIVGIIFDVEL